MDIYPYELPAGIHPYSWMFLGHGLSGKQCHALARQLFDELGARWSHDEEERITFSWAIDWALDPKGAIEASVGDTCKINITDRHGVRILDGYLPPGTTLNRHTGELTGTYTRPGLYTATFVTGPAIKWDALGSSGGPDDPGRWIPATYKRADTTPDLSRWPASAADLDDSQKAQLLAELQEWERAAAARARGEQ